MAKKNDDAGVRYARMAEQKTSGSTYTPRSFADFLAKAILVDFDWAARKKIRILDPSCGDGALLSALARAVPKASLKRCEFVGVDISEQALESAKKRMSAEHRTAKLVMHKADYLEAAESLGEFDVVIANPPYVRTQIMGSEASKKLAKRYGLTGKVDLYFPFMLAIADALTADGVAGIITSNRFMSTQSGKTVRKALAEKYALSKVWDLGDTKLFDAAVLPAIVVGSKAGGFARVCEFSSIYETNDACTEKASTPLEALSSEDGAVVECDDGRKFAIRKGILDSGGSAEGIWRVGNKGSDQWLESVEKHAWGRFEDIGKIRVGVKSTADKIFIREDWDGMPGGRPELVRPLISRECAGKFKAAIGLDGAAKKGIMYPHAVVDGKRVALDLDLYPLSKKYMEQHKKALSSRKYLIEAKRGWHELWVPQDPAAWAKPKLVFPDISTEPTFWLDQTGGVVNGECYWLAADSGVDESFLWLALAVANSSFIESFYDRSFNNKLYAGRRRFISQYVAKFPLPNPGLKESKRMVALAKKIHSGMDSGESKAMRELDALVWASFGLVQPVGK